MTGRLALAAAVLVLGFEAWVAVLALSPSVPDDYRRLILRRPGAADAPASASRADQPVMLAPR